MLDPPTEIVKSCNEETFEKTCSRSTGIKKTIGHYFWFPVPILAASDLIQALFLIIATLASIQTSLSHLIEATGGE